LNGTYHISRFLNFFVFFLFFHLKFLTLFLHLALL
jgi:hypothetical protein